MRGRGEDDIRIIDTQRVEQWREMRGNAATDHRYSTNTSTTTDKSDRSASHRSSFPPVLCVLSGVDTNVANSLTLVILSAGCLITSCTHTAAAAVALLIASSGEDGERSGMGCVANRFSV